MPPGLSSAMTMKRIQREIADLKKEDLGPMVLTPGENNLHIWTGSIPGPQGSLYEGGVFDLEIVLPADYPFSAPKVLFKTRIYHMNISEHGNICIDMLKQNWSPALSLFKVMLSLSSLLTDPNPNDPLVPSIAQQYLRRRKEHDATARKWTQTYAHPKPPAAAVEPPTDKAKGKTRAQVGPSNRVGSSSSTRRTTRSGATSNATPNIDSDVIVVSDGETGEPGQNAKGKKRKRDEGASAITSAQGSTSAAGAGASSGEVLYLVDSDDEQEATKRTKTRSRPQSRAERDSASGSFSRRPATQPGEVIVID